MSVEVRHPDADPATRSRGAMLRQLGGSRALGGIGTRAIATVSQKLGTERERETLLGADGLGMHQHKPVGGPLDPQLVLEPEPEPEPEPQPEQIAATAPAGSSRDDDAFRDGMFAGYLNRVEEKGCAWRQELNRCGIVLTFEASPRTSASIAAAQQLVAAAEARHDVPASAPTDLAPSVASPAREPAVSRGRVMVRSDRTADWVPGEIVSIEESSRLATVRYGSNSTVCVLLTDPTRVRLIPPHSPGSASR